MDKRSTEMLARKTTNYGTAMHGPLSGPAALRGMGVSPVRTAGTAVPRFGRGFAALCCLVVSVTLVMLACSSKPAFNPADIFPADNSVPGWVKSSDTRTFEATHLWEYIDGDADKYVRAGVVMTLTSDYQFDGKSDATADVYVMRGPSGAQQVYDAESAVGSQPLLIGDAGRRSQGNVTFRQGPYFVRLVAYDDSPGMAQGLVDLARAMSGRLSSQQR